MTPLLDTLRSLEVELHHPGVRCDRRRLDELLHPDFHEVGRSGRTYTRETVLAFLLGQVDPPSVRSDAFEARLLGPDIALLTYRSAHVADAGSLVHPTLRSSVWVFADGRWRLRYHQGTPAAEPW